MIYNYTKILKRDRTGHRHTLKYVKYMNIVTNRH